MRIVRKGFNLILVGGSLKLSFAYLDPGSGSILLQLLVAGLLGALVLLRSSWGRIKSLFQRDTQVEKQEDDENQDEKS
jgi:hypothetical protein